MDNIDQDLWKKIRRIEIKTDRLVNQILGGQYMSAFKGVGLEFDEVRPYQEGDDERRIDWNVTARTGQLHVKRFVEERELSIVIVVDCSASMYFGSQYQLKTDLIIEFFALIAFSAMRNNDRVGLLTYADSKERFIAPKKGRRHILHMIRDLSYLYASPDTLLKSSQHLENALTYLSHILHRRAVIFVVSDFIGTGDLFPLKVLNQRHDCIAVKLVDPLEKTLTASGPVLIRHPETGKHMVQNLTSRLKQSYLERYILQAQTLSESLRLMGVEEIELSTENTSVADTLSQFYRFH